VETVIAIVMALMLTAVLVMHLSAWGLATFGLPGWYVVTIGIAASSGAATVLGQHLVRRLKWPERTDHGQL
jgi:membrane protein implicated in regulation of membrane protease activity